MLQAAPQAPTAVQQPASPASQGLEPPQGAGTAAAAKEKPEPWYELPGFRRGPNVREARAAQRSKAPQAPHVAAGAPQQLPEVTPPPSAERPADASNAARGQAPLPAPISAAGAVTKVLLFAGQSGVSHVRYSGCMRWFMGLYSHTSWIMTTPRPSSRPPCPVKGVLGMPGLRNVTEDPLLYYLCGFNPRGRGIAQAKTRGGAIGPFGVSMYGGAGSASAEERRRKADLEAQRCVARLLKGLGAAPPLLCSPFCEAAWPLLSARRRGRDGIHRVQGDVSK